MYTIVIPREIKSGNEFAYKTHWKRTEDRNNWAGWFRVYGHLAPKAAGRRRVRVTAYRKRRIDDDNLCSGFKHGRDAMILVGLLRDDNRRYCEFDYEDCRVLSEMPGDLARKYGRVPLTVLEISELPALE